MRDVARALARVATNVAVITTGDLDVPHGVTANVWGESADPPVVLVTLKRSGRTLGLVKERGSFVANVLGLDQRDIAVRFARRETSGSRFEGVDVTPTECGPRLATCHAWFACQVDGTAPFGSYEIIVGAVRAALAGDQEEPLLFHGGAFKATGVIDGPQLGSQLRSWS